MGLLDKLFGRRDEPPSHRSYAAYEPGRPADGADEAALQRYRYMLRTAPPEAIEEAHAEAFAKLTPEQRRQVLQELAANTPEAERSLATGDDPRSLARLATRAEMRQPGITERIFARPSGPGFGTMMAGTIFGSLVAGFVGSMIANQFFDSIGDVDFNQGGWGDQGGSGDQAGESAATDFVDSGADFGGGMDLDI